MLHRSDLLFAFLTSCEEFRSNLLLSDLNPWKVRTLYKTLLGHIFTEYQFYFLAAFPSFVVWNFFLFDLFDVLRWISHRSALLLAHFSAVIVGVL